jgi:hypothetical protein
MKIKRYVLAFLLVLATGVLSFSVKAQPKKRTHHANFSGEWSAKESISMGGNIYCAYDEDDRMSSKILKIASQNNFLTIETPNSVPGPVYANNREKLSFDGKENKVVYGPGREKKFTVTWSSDGKTMTIKSISHQIQVVHYVTEIWKLSKDGKSISILSKAKSNAWGEERSWKTLFVKTN